MWADSKFKLSVLESSLSELASEYFVLERGDSKGLFTWSGGPRSSGVGFFCFHALGDTKEKKPTPLDRDPPLHVNRVKDKFSLW